MKNFLEKLLSVLELKTNTIITCSAMSVFFLTFVALEKATFFAYLEHGIIVKQSPLSSLFYVVPCMIAFVLIMKYLSKKYLKNDTF